MPKDKLEYYKAHDPVTIAREHLISQSDCTEQDIAEIEEKANRMMSEAVDYAKSCPQPSVENFLEEVKHN